MGFLINLFKNLLKGLAFGITETIPGVSAGTIAIILGFYFEIVETINHFFENLKKNIAFAIPFVIGIISGVLLFSSIMQYLLTNYSFPTMLFFIGLIVGIIPHIFSKVKTPGFRYKFHEILMVALPFALVITISFLKHPSAIEPEEAVKSITIPYMIFIFFAGMLAAAALVVPGISGSFVLLLLGIYPLAIFTLSSIRLLITGETTPGLVADICKVLGPLALGIIIGGLSMVRIIEKLLNNYSKALYLIILGLISGSVIALFNNPIVYKSGVTALMIVIGALTILAGFAIAFTLGKKRL
jgi:putative membrane protein